MARGGKREGAGRKRGSLTVRTQETAARALAEGKSPLDVMLENMCHFQQVAMDAEAAITALTAGELPDNPDDQFKMLLAKVKQAAGLRQMAHECARDAAPYIHPKLSAIAHTGPGGGPLEAVFKTIYEHPPG